MRALEPVLWFSVYMFYVPQQLVIGWSYSAIGVDVLQISNLLTAYLKSSHSTTMGPASDTPCRLNYSQKVYRICVYMIQGNLLVRNWN